MYTLHIYIIHIHYINIYMNDVSQVIFMVCGL